MFDLIRNAPAELHYEPGLVLADDYFVMIHGRFTGTGRQRDWIAVDIVRVENGRLAEHWDVLQDEATQRESVSGRPMFGDVFAADSEPRTHRRVVTGHRDVKSVVLSDERLPAYAFQTVSGFEQTYIWAALYLGR